MLDRRDLWSSILTHRLFLMPAARPSVPVSTRSIWRLLACCRAWIFAASSGAVALDVLTLLMTSLCALTKLSNMPCVSCRLPATSRTLRTTGRLGLSGIPPEPAGAGVLLLGAPQAAAASATAAAAASRTPGWRRRTGLSIVGVPLRGCWVARGHRRQRCARGWRTGVGGSGCCPHDQVRAELATELVVKLVGRANAGEEQVDREAAAGFHRHRDGGKGWCAHRRV